jgi:hypothetical protein
MLFQGFNPSAECFMTSGLFMLNKELRMVDRAAEAYDLLLKLAKEAADRGILASPLETRRAAFQKLDRVAVEGMAPIRSRRDAAGSRSGKTATFESCHVTVMSESGDHAVSRQFRLVAIRILLAHDEIKIEKLPLQAIFRFHAGEQMFYRGDIESGHFRALAEEILDWYYAIKIADAVLAEDGQERFTIPGPGTDGVVMGYLDQTAAVPAGELHQFVRGRKKTHVIAASPFAPALFIGNTYIGFNEIRPDQKDLRECWVEWRRYFSKSYELGLERVIWPFRSVAPPSADHGVEPDAVAAVRAFLLDPRALKTMQNRALVGRSRGSYEPSQEEEHEYDQMPLRNVG